MSREPKGEYDSPLYGYRDENSFVVTVVLSIIVMSFLMGVLVGGFL
jgi:hypothetical protein